MQQGNPPSDRAAGRARDIFVSAQVPKKHGRLGGQVWLFRRISELAWTGGAWSNEEFVMVLYLGFQALAYAMYLSMFLMWYCRLELVVPRFIQTCVRMRPA